MNLRFSITATLFRTELRMVLRDRRVLMTAILLPMLVTPLMFFGSSRAVKKREQRLRENVCRYAVSGPEAAKVHGLLAATSNRLEQVKGTNGNGAFRFSEVACSDATAALDKGDIELILEGAIASTVQQSNTTARPDRSVSNRRPRATKKTDDENEGEPSVPGATEIRIVYRADREFSAAAMNRMTDVLRDTRRKQRENLLLRRGFPVALTNVATITETNLASKGQIAGLTLGRSMTLVLLLFILTGGAVVATDSVAGEKERGTLETLLTTSARRVEIIAAKHLVILAIALLIALIQSANLFVYAGFRLLPIPANLSAAISPAKVVLLLLLYLPVLALIASVLLLVSGRAKTYREAQMYFFPVFLLGLVPAVAPFVPDLSLRSATVLVPVANIALAAKEILVGTFDWPFIVAAWAITAGAAAWVSRSSVRALSAEQLITASEADVVDFQGGAELFSRHVLRWFVVLWATLLIVSNYLEKTDIRWQLILNLVVLFFGASCLMLRHYQLNPREALALRAPKPMVWPAVLIAVPCGLLTASGLFRLANVFIPISPRIMREFEQNVIPPDISPAQLIFFLCVMPAIFEEITFRGMLLHGLSRRLRPATLAVTVGVVFGIFHVALFRFAPTACLGVMLAAVVLLTGSIFPAMLWHGLSNLMGLLAYQYQIPLEELDPLTYLLGTAILAVCFWIIWRNRTPYPGLRKA
jgi:ABC-type Na+ efflux pump permease subunit/membrane protease YdiL (CAAX protease family)